MTKLTFGKFTGWEPDDLAKTEEGRSWLDWASQNLRSPKWAKECDAALQSVPYSQVDTDFHLSVRAVMAAAPGITQDEAEQIVGDRIDTERFLREEAEQYERDLSAARQAAESLFAEYAAKSGQPSEKVRDAALYLRRTHERPEDAPEERFSSPARRALLLELCGRLAGNEWWEAQSYF